MAEVRGRSPSPHHLQVLMTWCKLGSRRASSKRQRTEGDRPSRLARSARNQPRRSAWHPGHGLPPVAPIAHTRCGRPAGAALISSERVQTRGSGGLPVPEPFRTPLDHKS